MFSNVTSYLQAYHLLIQEKIHQALKCQRMVVQEVQGDQEVLEAHVLTLLEDPARTQTAISIIIPTKRALCF
jgi:hypothetical protein